MNKEDLERCPFCGYEAKEPKTIMGDNNNTPITSCSNRGCIASSYLFPVKQWNKRIDKHLSKVT